MYIKSWLYYKQSRNPYVCIFLSLSLYIYIYIHMYTYTCMHAYTYIRSHLLSSSCGLEGGDLAPPQPTF